ncbi:ATP synthase subunit I [Bacillus sp. BRMEA1]|uniref:ATP synthase subunit I n=1 Tax=Neobacillus endophyticus TaxID=2738405 RepID=UPI0015657403|nr:ATP synthase subunit I [Neobacillus endophyticus]NRD77185.1 ATP synthase subunit I [Neobacillus endophyticus]
MLEIIGMYKRACKWMFYLLAVYVIGWGFTEYHSVFMGLILGTATSLINLMLLFRIMKKFDKSVTNGKKVKSLGSLSRLAMVAISVMVAIKWTQYFNLISVVMGLMTNYIVIMIDFLIQSLNVHKKDRK